MLNNQSTLLHFSMEGAESLGYMAAHLLFEVLWMLYVYYTICR